MPRFIRLAAHRPSARFIAAGCLLLFAALTVLVMVSEGLLLAVDRGVERSVLGVRSGGLDGAMVALTFLGTRWVIGGVTLALVVWSVWTGKARALTAVVVVAVLLNPIVEFGFKELVDRVRPDTAQLLAGRGPSFPSGHVLASVGFYGMAPLLAWETARSRNVQLGTLVGSSVVILIVAVSRVYLDVHWSTDVVAAMLLGTVLVLGAGHIHLSRRRRGAAHTPVTGQRSTRLFGPESSASERGTTARKEDRP